MSLVGCVDDMVAGMARSMMGLWVELVRRECEKGVRLERSSAFFFITTAGGRFILLRELFS